MTTFISGFGFQALAIALPSPPAPSGRAGATVDLLKGGRTWVKSVALSNKVNATLANDRSFVVATTGLYC
jgi:hypothetical protein